MNFALMFALAVGTGSTTRSSSWFDFRGALRTGLQPVDAIAVTMDSAGRTVLINGAAVLGSLATVMIVPLPDDDSSDR